MRNPSPLGPYNQHSNALQDASRDGTGVLSLILQLAYQRENREKVDGKSRTQGRNRRRQGAKRHSRFACLGGLS